MADGYDVDVNEVRTHAATVADIAEQVAAAAPAARVGDDAFGPIASFFATAVTSAGDQLGEVFTSGARSVGEVRAGLTSVAEVYQHVEETIARRFGGDEAAVVPAKLGRTQPPAPPGQRAKAVAVLEKISAEHPVSVATVALRPVRTAHDWVGDVASAEIGDHYEKDVAHLLRRPPTDANLRLMADTETRFWQSDRGNLIGAAMPASARYSMLLSARDAWLAELPPTERDRIAQEHGIRPR